MVEESPTRLLLRSFLTKEEEAAVSLLSIPLELTDPLAEELMNTAEIPRMDLDKIKKLPFVRTGRGRWWLSGYVREELRTGVEREDTERAKRIYTVMFARNGREPAHSRAVRAYYGAPIVSQEETATEFQSSFYEMGDRWGLAGHQLVTALATAQRNWLGEHAADAVFYQAFLRWVLARSARERRPPALILESILPPLRGRNLAVALHLVGAYYAGEKATWGKAQEYLEASLRQVEHSERGRGEAQATLAMVLQNRGLAGSDNQLLERALEVAMASSATLTHARGNYAFPEYLIGSILTHLGLPSEALHHLDAALAASEKFRVLPDFQARVLNDSALTLRDLGAFEEAVAAVEGAAAAARGPILAKVRLTARSLVAPLLDQLGSGADVEEAELLALAEKAATLGGHPQLSEIQDRLQRLSSEEFEPPELART